MEVRNFKKNKSGIINLISVFGIGLFALGAALSIEIGVLTELAKNQNAVASDQVFYTAEANTTEGIYQYINEIETTSVSTYTGGATPLLNNTDSNSITAEPAAWPYVKVRGSSNNDDTNRAVIHTVTVFPEGQAFDYGVYAQNQLTFGGNITVNGNIFANDGIEFNGNNAEINGDAFSPVPITDQDNINGEAVDGLEPIFPPDIVAGPYKDEAILEGTYFAFPANAEAYLNNFERENIIFVDSAVKTKIQGANTSLKGSLVTAGDLDLTGGTYTAANNYAAIVVYGNLKIAGGAIINGVVYVKGSTSFGGGNNVINGSLVSAGGASVTDVTGSATINYDQNLATIWPDLAGLDTTTNEPPKIILWNEE